MMKTREQEGRQKDGDQPVSDDDDSFLHSENKNTQSFAKIQYWTALLGRLGGFDTGLKGFYFAFLRPSCVPLQQGIPNR